MKKIFPTLCILFLFAGSAYATCTGTSSPFTCSTWADLEACVEHPHTACSGFTAGSTILIGSNLTASSRIDIREPMTIDGGGRCNDRNTTSDGCGEVANPGGTWPITVTGPGSSDATDDWGLIINADAADYEINVVGLHFIGTWTSGRNTHEDYGAIGLGSDNATVKWTIHDNKWSGTGLRMGLHKITRGGLIYKNSIQITDATGTIYIVRVKDTQVSETATSVSGGYTTRLMVNSPTWGESYGVFFEDNSFNQANWSSAGATIDAAWGVKITIRYNYFFNGWVSSHGATNATVIGATGWEIYNNTFEKDKYMVNAISLRSGSLLAHDNYISIAASGWSDAAITYNDEGQRVSDNLTSWENPTMGMPWDGTGTSSWGYSGYPYFGQVGWPQTSGYTYTIVDNNPGASSSDMQPLTLWKCYSWNNAPGNDVLNNSTRYVTNGIEYRNCTSGCVEGTDYPTGYTAYTYPHPLRSTTAPPQAQGCVMNGSALQ